MEVGRGSRIETQTDNVHLVSGLASVRQRDPLLRGGVAHDVQGPVDGGGGAPQAAEEEAVAAIKEVDSATVGQEVEGGAERSEDPGVTRDLKEVESEHGKAFHAVGGVEEACEGLGQRLGEAQPVLAHLLAAPPVPGGDAGDDLEQEVVDEGLGRRPGVVWRRGTPARTEMDERSVWVCEGRPGDGRR